MKKEHAMKAALAILLVTFAACNIDSTEATSYVEKIQDDAGDLGTHGMEQLRELGEKFGILKEKEKEERTKLFNFHVDDSVSAPLPKEECMEYYLQLMRRTEAIDGFFIMEMNGKEAKCTKVDDFIYITCDYDYENETCVYLRSEDGGASYSYGKINMDWYDDEYFVFDHYVIDLNRRGCIDTIRISNDYGKTFHKIENPWSELELDEIRHQVCVYLSEFNGNEAVFIYYDGYRNDLDPEWSKYIGQMTVNLDTLEVLSVISTGQEAEMK